MKLSQDTHHLLPGLLAFGAGVWLVSLGGTLVGLPNPITLRFG